MNKKIITFFIFAVVFLGFSGLNVIQVNTAFAEDDHGDNQDSSHQSHGDHQDGQINGGEQNHTRSDNQNESQNRTMFENHDDNKNMSENESDNRNMFENHDDNKTMSESVEGDLHEEHHKSVFTPTQQDIQNINQAKVNQTIAAEVNIGTNQSTTTIDNNVSVQTTSNTPDSLNVNVSAPSQTGPKVIVFNLNATTVNLQNLNNLGVMYDGKLIQPAPNMDAILHAKSTDNPSFAIVVTQSGIQVLVLVPHFSTHSITIMNMSQVIAPAVPEFPFTAIVLAIATLSIVLISRMKQHYI
ncbi:MAG: PEFG-CTERM sorting domain-containing protein [Thaumarchaeota archaeon]|nr:PEFG-CTERM sorting domain-containing protein [Nitrososphaerota archaeon]